MKKIPLILAALCIGLLLNATPVTATVQGPYDIMLSNDHDDDHLCNQTGSVTKTATIIAFDYWYEPDPVPEIPGLRGIGSKVIVESEMGRHTPLNEMTQVYAFFPSKSWHTVFFELDQTIVDSNNVFRMEMPPVYASTELFMDTPAYNRLLDNKFYFRNLRGYETYEDYTASLSNDAQPVPEPATMAMLASGLAGFVASRIRKHVKNNC